jgi:hypothetical protein
MKSITAIIVVSLLTGCAGSARVARAPSATPRPAIAAARWFVPAAPEPATFGAEETPDLHVDLPADDVARLDALLAVDSEQSPHVGGEHLVRALPFDCVQPFAIGICAVAPVSESAAGDDP